MIEKVFSFVAVLAMAACGNLTDPTPNRPDPTMNGDYPSGPYGYVQGSVMQDIGFIGKVPPKDASPSADLYSRLAVQSASLKKYHNNPAVKILFLVGVARWCSPCNDEQPAVRNLAVKYAEKGVQVVEMLAEGMARGVAATEDDISGWGKLSIPEGFMGGGHGLTLPIFLDPNGQMQQFADVSAYPLAMAIRTDSMTIEYLGIGERDNDAALAQLVQ